uniref:Glycerol-3-phosphate dehydrogenase [NAD(P)+] n=1 Tax=Magnetococcus massalia (strain MO-1) TaxID=451514 RepID=A0A1S7LIP5_MAGMO|nr:glycerol-3-phosphate dehydrogenase [NAD(P)+] [Candidatus Magnetococcus massalia]
MVVEDAPVAVVGAGSWGTALASLLAVKRTRITLWAREEEVVAGINQNHHNPHFLTDLELPKNLRAEGDLAGVTAHHKVLVMVVPTQFTRAVLAQMKPHLQEDAVLVFASKGIETAQLSLVSEMCQQELPEAVARRACYLSGPSFAREVVAKQPAAVSIAGADGEALEAIQALFFLPYFRTYSTQDVAGVELGGALKNVIALAAGISDGLGFGNSARAALITRGLAEISRLGRFYGAQQETFAGLSGLGDMLMTASSTLSRNYSTGYRLGQGETLDEIRSGSREVAEGVKTTEAAYQLAQKRQVDMPITQAVYAVLYEGVTPEKAVAALMGRGMKSEVE